MDSSYLNNHSDNIDKKFSIISEIFVQKIISKNPSLNFIILSDKINGISHRLESFNYHKDLIKRELYDAKDKALKLSEKKRELFGVTDKNSDEVMRDIMKKST